MANSAAFLTVRGSEIVNQAGEPVVLRGFGLGGSINMEFSTGYDGNEVQRNAMGTVLGPETYEGLRGLPRYYMENCAQTRIN